ncbi:MAG: LLM class flavin-dependent oxidoreductase [Thermomicrobiales bacterium]
MPHQPLSFCLELSHHRWLYAESPAAGVARVVELARLADEAGLDSIWVSEDTEAWDAFAVLGALARETARIRLGTGVVNPFHRHPNLIAASVATLDHLSGGRAFLGLGRGQPEWYERALGVDADAPLARLDQTFDLLHQWWHAPHRATSDGPWQIREWERTINPLQTPPPIYLAAVGPKALKLAGKRADGVLFNELSSVTFMSEAIATVRRAAADAGRDPERLAFFARVGLMVTDNPEPVLQRRKNVIAMIHTLPGMDRLIQTPDFDVPAIMTEVRRLMRTEDTLAAGGGFADLRRAGDIDAARAAIPTELVARLAVVGSAQIVRQRLAELTRIGVTHVFVSGADMPREGWSALLDRIRPG